MKNYLTSFVFYDDTDCGGIMYHSNYIKACERARSLVFFEADRFPYMHEYPSLEGFVVKTIESDYIAPLRLGDFYEVQTKVVEIKNTSMILKQEIHRLKEIGKASSPLLAFRLSIVMVYVGSDKRPKKIPQVFRDLLAPFCD